MKNLRDYFALIAFLSLGLAVFWFFNYNRDFQIYVILSMGLAHFLWGLVHHGLKKELHLQIIVEYLAISLIGSLSLVFLLMRA